MSGLPSAAGAANAVWRNAGAAAVRRSLATSAALQRRFPRAKLPLNTDLLPRSERLEVSVTDKPDPSRGIPLPDGGIKYYGFIYYPRFADRADPPVAPAKLHRVELIYPVTGQPYWIRNICQQLGIHGPKESPYKSGASNVVKNIPEVNAMLYRVKHLVRIDPVTFPDGEPTSDDLDGWQLLEDGRVVRNAHYSTQVIESDHQRLKLPDDTVRQRLRLRWIKPFHLDEKRTV